MGGMRIRLRPISFGSGDICFLVVVLEMGLWLVHRQRGGGGHRGGAMALARQAARGGVSLALFERRTRREMRLVAMTGRYGMRRSLK
jgi:hypothetical protein